MRARRETAVVHAGRRARDNSSELTWPYSHGGIDVATTRPGLHLAELTRPILTESCRLPAPFSGDPADQIIVATARDRDAIIVTRDDQIRGYAHVRSLW